MDLSVNRLIAETDAAKEMLDVRSEALAAARMEANEIIKNANARFDEADKEYRKRSIALTDMLTKRGLIGAAK